MVKEINFSLLSRYIVGKCLFCTLKCTLKHEKLILPTEVKDSELCVKSSGVANSNAHTENNFCVKWTLFLEPVNPP